MGAIEILNILMALIDAGANGLATAQKVSSLIQQRRTEGRVFTKADLALAIGEDDAARAELKAAVIGSSGSPDAPGT